MKTELWLIGKTDPHLTEGISIFEKRINHYTKFDIKYFNNYKKGTIPGLIKAAESKLVMDKLVPSDYLIILDERGKQFSSEKFAGLISNLMAGSRKKIVFHIGGAYGVDDTLRTRADLLLSLSSMTFSHQVVRLVFMEQFYRAFTIIHNEPYHHA